MKLSLLPNAVYLFKPSEPTNQSQLQTERLSFDKFNKHVGVKQFM